MSSVKHGHEGFVAATSGDAPAASTPNNIGSDDAMNAESGNVDKIREILFGGQMRDYDKRFNRLEERLLKESAELREDSSRRVEALETFMKNEFAALVNRLHAEQQSREGSVQKLSRELNEAIKTHSKKYRRLALGGHEPDLGELTARLLGARGGVEFKKGGVCLIEVDGATPGGPGTLRWMLPPKALRGLKP